MRNTLLIILLTLIEFNSPFAQSIGLQFFVNGKPAEKTSKDVLSIEGDQNLLIVLDTLASLDSVFYQLIPYDSRPLPLRSNYISYSDFEPKTYQFYIWKDSLGEKKNLNNSFSIIKVVESKKSFLNNWTFLLLLGIYLVLIVGGAIFFIILSNRRSKEKVADLRNDWTNKLHNDLGGDLSGIQIRLETLEKSIEDLDPKIKKRVKKVSKILLDVQQKLRLVFDLVDPKKDSLKAMLADVVYFGKDGAEENGMRFEYDNQVQKGQIINIDIGRINKLYLIIKEALNNAIKYSKGSALRLHLSFKDQVLYLRIEDDGVGFDREKIEMGSGILNMEAYSKEGFMEVKIHSEEGKGTTVEIWAPSM